MFPVRKSLSLANIELSYLEWNTGKEPLLLLHGLADCALVWSKLGDSLADKYHIIAPDLRGHGDSSKPDWGYTFDQAIADLEALMDDQGWNSAHILGHSWTGKLAPIWAQKHPERFRSMIIVDPIFINQMSPWIKLTFPILYLVLHSLKLIGPFSSLEIAEKTARQLSQYQGWNPLQELVFKGNIEEKSDGTWGSKFIIPARNQMFEEVMRISGLSNPIEIPTLFVQSEKGVNRTEWQLKPYKTYLKNLQISVVKGNHWPFLLDPEGFNQAVGSFLNHFS